MKPQLMSCSVKTTPGPTLPRTWVAVLRKVLSTALVSPWHSTTTSCLRLASWTSGARLSGDSQQCLQERGTHPTCMWVAFTDGGWLAGSPTWWLSLLWMAVTSIQGRSSAQQPRKLGLTVTGSQLARACWSMQGSTCMIDDCPHSFTHRSVTCVRP
jgi:hypothetical protein